MTISKRFLSCLMMAIFMVGSLPLSAMQPGNSDDPYILDTPEMSVWHTIRTEDLREPGELAPMPLSAMLPDGDEKLAGEQVAQAAAAAGERNIPTGPYQQKLKETLEESLRIAKITRQLAENVGFVAPIAHVALVERQISNQLRGLPAESEKGLFTQEEAQGFQQAIDKWQAMLDSNFKDAMAVALKLGRHDLVAELEGKPLGIFDRNPLLIPGIAIIGVGIVWASFLKVYTRKV
jgi:hypothetical protein